METCNRGLPLYRDRTTGVKQEPVYCQGNDNGCNNANYQCTTMDFKSDFNVLFCVLLVNLLRTRQESVTWSVLLQEVVLTHVHLPIPVKALLLIITVIMMVQHTAAVPLKHIHAHCLINRERVVVQQLLDGITTQQLALAKHIHLMAVMEIQIILLHSKTVKTIVE
uniref:Phlebovirus_G2 domain-containing protein n=1 Tax=Heterorhabditis bacteriophora TaxID=37862 RepID=A0A1I7XPX5_HETBA